MKIFYTALASIFSIVYLFVLTKIIGKRQMSQLSVFDYVVGITIGSIAAELATELETPLYPATAMLIYTLITILMAYLSTKSIKLRRFFEGKAVILYQNGTVYKKNLKSSHMDINELLVQCRTNGYFNLSELEYVIMEPNGKLSFLPLAANRPATNKDIGLSPQNSGLVCNVIIDGKIMEKNLDNVGKNRNWLMAQIKEPTESIMLATLDNSDTITIYKKVTKKNNRDYFE